MGVIPGPWSPGPGPLFWSLVPLRGLLGACLELLVPGLALGLFGACLVCVVVGGLFGGRRLALLAPACPCLRSRGRGP